MSVGDRLGTSQSQDYVLLAALAVGAYVLYKVFGAVATVGNAVGSAASAIGAGAQAVGHAAANTYTSTVDALSSGLYSLFGPADIGTNQYFIVNFPDGSRHAVPSNIVDGNGIFTWTGYPANSQPDIQLQLVKDSGGNWYATAFQGIAMSPSQLQPVTIDAATGAVSPVNLGAYGRLGSNVTPMRRSDPARMKGPRILRNR